MRALLLVALVLTACSAPGQRGEQVEATPARDRAAFDVDAVIASLSAECEQPIVVDDLFCEQVVISDLSADGTTLVVPTTLNAEAADRAAVICDQLATIHFDADGNDLGYTVIGVRDRDNGNAAACTV